MVISEFETGLLNNCSILLFCIKTLKINSKVLAVLKKSKVWRVSKQLEMTKIESSSIDVRWGHKIFRNISKVHHALGLFFAI